MYTCMLYTICSCLSASLSTPICATRYRRHSCTDRDAEIALATHTYFILVGNIMQDEIGHMYITTRGQEGNTQHHPTNQQFLDSRRLHARVLVHTALLCTMQCYLVLLGQLSEPHCSHLQCKGQGIVMICHTRVQRLCAHKWGLCVCVLSWFHYAIVHTDL